MPPLLISVSVVCRSHARLTVLPEAEYIVEAYIDNFSDRWTLENASRRGFVRLLDRLGEREWSRVSLHFRELRLKHAIDEVVALQENVPVLHWWLTNYLPEKRDSHSSDIFTMAVQYNRLNVLKWLKEHDLLRNIDLTRTFTSVFPQITRWLHVNLPGVRMKISLTRCSTESDFEFVKWALRHESVHKVCGVANCFDDAAFNGNLLLLEWLHQDRSERCDPQMLTRVIYNEQLEVAKWLWSTYPEEFFDDPAVSWFEPLDNSIKSWLAFEYHWKDVLKRKAWIHSSIKIAVETRDSKSLEFFLNIQTSSNCYKAMQRCVDRGDLKLAQMLLTYQAPVSVFCLDTAAARGHLEMIQWLDGSAPVMCTTKAMNMAAAFNHLDVVKWLQANRSEGCTTNAMDHAAGGGHLEMVRWLHTYRSEGCTNRAMEKAAGRGYLDIVKWMHENRSEGCTTYAMDKAAELGHLDVVQWLHEHRTEGCSRFALSISATAGNLDIVRYLHENQLGGNEEDDQDTADSPACNGDLDMLRFFHEQRHTNCSSEGLDGAASNGHMNVVAWIHENNPDLPVFEGLYLVAQKGDLAMMKYLVMNFDCSIDTELFDTIASYKQFALLEWLLRYCTEVANMEIDTPFLAQD